ncbi:MAG: NAD(P)H-hydrate dehydratase [Oscillospiraceae bacterium]|jgi:NAD(P)H-hydrate epimerase|nr:NAD(P)H-hydrate dehydratase [Oscillospiraceae bacterium]
MRLYSVAEVRAAEEYALHMAGIPDAKLMSDAAEHLVTAALEFRRESGDVLVLCGTGNNGGDGIAAAALLRGVGVPVRAFLVGRRERMTSLSREMERRLVASGGLLEDFDADVVAAVPCGVIIDALFGIGLNAPPTGDALAAIRFINTARYDSRHRMGLETTVISADIPSGVAADSGLVAGEAVRADVTVAFIGAKVGHFSMPGRMYCGELRVRDLGVPLEALSGAESRVFAVTSGDVTLPRREPDTHKGDYGKLLIAAGCRDYMGAPVIAARAATRAGAGLVFLGVPTEILPIVAAKCDGEVVFAYDGVSDALKARLDKCDAALIGCGMGDTPETFAMVAAALRGNIPLILDADGINALSGHIDVLDEAACSVVLTPHEGEFTRLGGDLSAGRLAAAVKFAAEHGCVVILKGYSTVVAFPDGSAYINTTGSPAMAKGGMGDALAGVLAALIAQGFPLKDACIAAVYLHGLAGDLAAERLGEYALAPGDVIAALSDSFKSVTER